MKTLNKNILVRPVKTTQKVALFFANGTQIENLPSVTQDRGVAVVVPETGCPFHDCEFVKAGDEICWEKGSMYHYVQYNGEQLGVIEERRVMAKGSPEKGYKPAPGKVIIVISERERDKIFERSFTRNDGTTGSLVISIEAKRMEDQFYEQRVGYGRVAEVAENVSWIRSGDDVILDYTVDANEHQVLYSNEDVKAVVLDAAPSYYSESRIHSANRAGQKADMVEYYAGEMKGITLVIAMLRDGQVIANKPWVLLEHEQYEGFDQTATGLFIPSQPERVTRRRILAAPPKCDFKQGDIILVEWDSLFERANEKSKFDVCLETDILLGLKELPNQLNKSKDDNAGPQTSQCDTSARAGVSHVSNQTEDAESHAGKARASCDL